MLKILLLRLIILVLNILFLLYIYWLPPIDLAEVPTNPNLPSATPTLTTLPHAQPVLEDKDCGFLNKEFDKASSEILKRIEFENSWFQTQFLIVGAILTGILGFFGWSEWKGNGSTPGKLPIQRLHRFVESTSGRFAIAGALTASILIDIQIRRNILVTNQLGKWLEFYYERIVVDSELARKGFLGWEQLLRTPETGMHTDPYFSLFFWTPLSSLTLFLFAAFSWLNTHPSFQHLKGEFEGVIAKIAFFAVHVALIIYACTSRTVPSVYTVALEPIKQLKGTPAVANLIAGLVAVGLTVLNYRLVFVISKTRRQEGGRTRSTS